MKNVKIYITTIIITVIGLLSLNSCDVNNITELNFQIPLDFYSRYNDRVLPDSSIEYTDLNDYSEYAENRENIEDAEFLHFNYWISELDLVDTLDLEEVELERIAFYIQFLNASGTPISGERYLLGEYNDVVVADYIKTARHIEPIEGAVGEQISKAVQQYPRFNIITNYTDIKGLPRARINTIYARFDMTLRFTAKFD